MKAKTVHFNCDLGEGGAFDAAIMPLISSCNIACGGHYGDKTSILKAMQLAKTNHVKIGAHPSYPDPANFGRKTLQMSDKMLLKSLIAQLETFFELAFQVNLNVHHIKPHGALYHDVANHKGVAQLFLEAVSYFSKDFFLVTNPNSVLTNFSELQNKFYIEVFADRRYTNTGDLVSRQESNSVLTQPDEVYQQVFNFVTNKQVKTLSGSWFSLFYDTICFHSDSPNAVQNLHYTHQRLANMGYKIQH